MSHSDVIVVGGGIVGLATAWQITQRFSDCSVTILEKESQVGSHQSGHNSGVLHSGIYYKPGSLRAENCRAGKLAMEQFCGEEGIPFDICGKVIVAVDESEIPRLETIYERGVANQVKCEIIDADRLAELEPYATGVRAIHVPEAGIADYPAVCHRLAEKLNQAGHTIQTSQAVKRIDQKSSEVKLTTANAEFRAKHVVNCCGLHSDRIARLSGKAPDMKIVPFRGEYFQLKPEVEHYCKALIYPVPDPNFPFLGVHFTRMIGGEVECGPNAVFAFAREGYTKWKVNFRDLAESLSYSGFLRLAAKHWKMGCGEMWRSFSKRAFVNALQRLMPCIEKKHLIPAPAGVRAQALKRDGNLVDDFCIEVEGRVINVCNAPSPAATASLNIGRLIAEQVPVS